ncbi:TetR/AcrR family transcriptional regulator [Cellulomonas iranensis]|uniref:TetR/AcrR family transcriptional regulator n=1 Tax=Cellulomonas iranensis TaxID=76862 RepID=UPI001CF22D48|nr:TetR/AcrR family transcriptional regulator [Cellulomonas iranensis]UCN15079.1 TetR/AcrR family transcriptional regulator [Cellulomonas iranensis]
MTADAARPPTRPGTRSAARERLLGTASALFYAEGVRAVGVDRVVTEAAVTRATFYRHFTGKEALVVAYLDAVDAGVRERAGELPDAPDDVAAWLRRLTAEIGDELCRPGFRGCAFINAAAEYPDAASPVRVAVLRHREWLQDAATRALARTGHPDPRAAGSRWMALRDGAMVGAYLGDVDDARTALRAGVDDLLAGR